MSAVPFDPTHTEGETSCADQLISLRSLGATLSRFEHSVVNLIASDNAFPRSMRDHPAYTGHMIQEGLVGKRPFAGAAIHDQIETLAVEIACRVFRAEHANLQPHSCSQANQAVYHAVLKPGDTVLALCFQTGGHLTHGLKHNFSGRHFNFVHYGSDQRGLIDYEAAETLARHHNPKLIICGSSSYPRLFDSVLLRTIADSVGATLMFDLSHEAGLIAGGSIPNIIGDADIVTMSTDKTLRGPFGGLILCRKGLAPAIDKAVHPGTQSSFPLQSVSAKAHALALTQTATFKSYAHAVIKNAKVFERAFPKECLATGGTDKHYVVLNVHKQYGMNGSEAERLLERVGVLSSRQSLSSDASKKMSDAGGLRFGTAWATSRGYDENDISEICDIIDAVLSGSAAAAGSVRDRVSALVARDRMNDVWN